MRNRPEWRQALLGVALAVVLSLAACGDDDSPESGAESGGSDGEAPVVRLQGLSGGLSAVALKVIEIRGLDEKHGFTGEYQYIPADAASQNFLLGKSDVNFDSGPPDLPIAAKEDYDVVSFSGEARNHVTIIAPADSEYTDIQSLKGKKIGWFGADSTAALSISMLLEDDGLNFFKDFEFSQADPAGLVPLLKSGQVEAIVTFQPWASWADSQIEGGVKTIYDPGEDWAQSHPGGNVWTTIVGTKREWLEANPELAQSVRDAWCEASEYMNANMSEVVQEPEVQELLAPAGPDTGLDVMASWVEENQVFGCGWSEEEIADVNAFLDMMAEQGTLFEENPGNQFESLPASEG
jgi:ABC-type nitrate/sulfonate/bicarbonate transport system substrate-binding protein